MDQLRAALPAARLARYDRACANTTPDPAQYTSPQLATAAAELGVLRSMGRTGVCWDNATAESFWSTFKNEYDHRYAFAAIDAARRGAYIWIDGWCNAGRRHPSIGCLSP